MFVCLFVCLFVCAYVHTYIHTYMCMKHAFNAHDVSMFRRLRRSVYVGWCSTTAPPPRPPSLTSSSTGPAPRQSSTPDGPPRSTRTSCGQPSRRTASKTTSLRVGKGRGMVVRAEGRMFVCGVATTPPMLPRHSLVHSGANLHLSMSPGAASPASPTVAPPTMGVAPTSIASPHRVTCQPWLSTSEKQGRFAFTSFLHSSPKN